LFGSGEVVCAFAFAGVFFFAALRALAFEVFFVALRAVDFRALFLATIAPLLADGYANSNRNVS
jgi:hypothetical protein